MQTPQLLLQRHAGLGSGIPNKCSVRKRQKFIFVGRGETCSKNVGVLLKRFFSVLLSDHASIFAKPTKTRAGIKPKITRNNSYCVILFLDLIPTLCFRIHRREDGSLCQSILFFRWRYGHREEDYIAEWSGIFCAWTKYICACTSDRQPRNPRACFQKRIPAG